MLKIPTAGDARAAAEKRAAEILEGDMTRGRGAIENAVADAIERGQTSVDDVEVPRSVSESLCSELRAAGYSVRSHWLDSEQALDINWSRASR